MNQFQKAARVSIFVFLFATFWCGADGSDSDPGRASMKVGSVIVHYAKRVDLSPPFALSHFVVPNQLPEAESEPCCSLSPDFPDRYQESNDPPLHPRQ